MEIAGDLISQLADGDAPAAVASLAAAVGAPPWAASALTGLLAGDVGAARLAVEESISGTRASSTLPCPSLPHSLVPSSPRSLAPQARRRATSAWPSSTPSR